MSEQIRCKQCGRFMGQKDFDKHDFEVHFVPDTPFNEEVLEYSHKSCIDKLWTKAHGDFINHVMNIAAKDIVMPKVVRDGTVKRIK